MRPEQQGKALDAFRDDFNHKNPAPTLIILDDDEPEESHPNTTGQGRGSAGTSVTSSQSVQLVEARIAKKVKERIVLCTACGTRITRLEVVKHPMLFVAICRPCKIKCKTHIFTKVLYCTDSQGFSITTQNTRHTSAYSNPDAGGAQAERLHAAVRNAPWEFATNAGPEMA